MVAVPDPVNAVAVVLAAPEPVTPEVAKVSLFTKPLTAVLKLACVGLAAVAAGELIDVLLRTVRVAGAS